MPPQKRLLPRVKNASLRSEVIDSIRQAILSGTLPPGTPLRAYALAQDLGVSQGTVREALGYLQNQGLVANIPGVGTAVTRLSTNELRERISLRAMLEGQAGVEASPKMTPTEFAELDRRLQALCRAVEGNLYFESAEADLRFHRYIWRCSANETLYNVLDQLSAPIFAFIAVMRKHGFDDSGGGASAVAWQQTSHQPIIDALKGGDPELIRKAFTAGIVTFYDRYYEWAMKRQPGLPSNVLDDTVASGAVSETA